MNEKNFVERMVKLKRTREFRQLVPVFEYLFEKVNEHDQKLKPRKRGRPKGSTKKVIEKDE